MKILRVWTHAAPSSAPLASPSDTYLAAPPGMPRSRSRSEEHTSELQSRQYLVCRLLLEKKKIKDSLILISTYETVHSFPSYYIRSHRKIPASSLSTPPI